MSVGECLLKPILNARIAQTRLQSGSTGLRQASLVVRSREGQERSLRRKAEQYTSKAPTRRRKQQRRSVFLTKVNTFCLLFLPASASVQELIPCTSLIKYPMPSEPMCKAGGTLERSSMVSVRRSWNEGAPDLDTILPLASCATLNFSLRLPELQCPALINKRRSMESISWG